MPTHPFKITTIESQCYEWDKPPIWNGMHVYDKGRLHLVKVTAKSGTEEVVGYGFNGGTAATRPLSIFPKFVDLFRPALIDHDVTDTAYVSRLAEKLQNLRTRWVSYASYCGDKSSVLGYSWENRRQISSRVTWRDTATYPHLYRRWLLWSREGIR